MISVLRALAARRDQKTLRQFFARYAGRTLIIHKGLTMDWLEELLKLGGAAGHFRIDARQAADRKSPVLWITHHFILPLELPLPLLCDVGKDCIAVRHLRSQGRLGHPAEIGWILDDMRHKSRRHALLVETRGRLVAQRELPPDDNAFEWDFAD